MASRSLLVGIFLAGALLLSGCGESGPELGTVHGTVTMDGKPVNMAFITFRRQDHTGRPSVGTTDKDGHYTLGYTMSRDGALLGDFSVTISTLRDMPGRDAEGLRIDPAPETIPAEYNLKSKLTAKVESGSQEINFDLKSGGKVVSSKSQFDLTDTAKGRSAAITRQ